MSTESGLGAPFDAVLPGDPWELVVDVDLRHTVGAFGEWRYGVDATVGQLTIGAETSVFALATPNPALQVVDGGLASSDHFSCTMLLDGAPMQARVAVDDGDGTTFASADLSQLVGLLYGPFPLSKAELLLSDPLGAPLLQGSVDALYVEIAPRGLGVRYCTAAPNSTGLVAEVSAFGSNTAAWNDLTLVASGLPAHSVGFFLVSRTSAFVPNPGGSAGNFCLGGLVGRFVGPGQDYSAGAGGTLLRSLDLLAWPGASGASSVVPDDSWSFTAWYRDTAAGAPTSNFTDGVRVRFR